MEQTLVIRPDGSGALHARYRVAESTLKAFSPQLPSGQGRLEPSVDVDPETLRRDFAEYEEHGVRVVDADSRVEGGIREVNLSLSFQDLAGLSRTPFFARAEISLRRAADGRVTFRQSRRPSAPGEPSPLDLSDPHADAALQAWLEGLRAVLKVVVPGPILDTNATESDRHEARWVFDLNQDPDAARRLDQALLLIEFDGRDLKSLPDFGRQFLRMPAPP